MRARVLGILLLVVAAGVGWSLWRSGAPGVGEEHDAPGTGDVVPGAVDARDVGLARGANATRAGAGLGPSGVPAAYRGGGALVGTVRRRGAPTAASVAVRYVSDAVSPWSRRRRGGIFGRILAAPIASDAPIATAVAGADGRYVVEGLAAGEYHVSATAAGSGKGFAFATIPLDRARAQADVVVSSGTEVLAGRVVFADGRPWKGSVVVDPSAGPRSSSYVSGTAPIAVDVEGRFRAEGLEAGSYVVNLVDPEAMRLVSRPVTVPQAGGEQVFTIPAGEPIEGRVVAHADGAPVPGAEILAHGAGGDFRTVAVRATSRLDGGFRIPVVAGAREQGLTVSAVGFGPQMGLKLDAGAGTLEVRLRRTGRLIGRVTSDGGGPIGGLRVTVSTSGQRFSFAPEPGSTDTDGRYTIDDVEPGDATVVADGGGWVTKGAGDVGLGGFNPLLVAIAPGETATADLIVVRGARILGVVLGPEGRPVAGAVVRADVQTESHGMRGAEASHRVATGDDGIFAFDSLVEGVAYSIVASAADAAETREAPIFATTSSPGARVELRLVAPRVVTVTVIDAETEKPVAGAQVIRHSVPIGPNAWSDQSQGSTSSEGRVDLSFPRTGEAQVTVRHADYENLPTESVPESVDRVTLRMTRGLPVTARVLTPDRKPAEGVPVTLHVVGTGRVPGHEISDGDGRVRFAAVRAGTYELSARGTTPELSAFAAKSTAVAGGAEAELLLAKTASQGSRIFVRVRDLEGRIVPRASVTLRSRSRSHGTTTTEGVAEMDLGPLAFPEDGERFVDVRAAADGSGVALPLGPATVGPLSTGQTEVEVRLPPEKTIAGVVVDPDGTPVRGVGVVAAGPEQERDVKHAFQEWAELPNARTDAEGRFRIGRLGDGDVKLFAVPPPDFPAPDPVTARGGMDGVEIRLARGTAVTITVVGEGGPIAGATVSIAKEVPSGRGLSSPRVPTGPDGTLRLRGLDPKARYAVDVQGPRGEWMPAARADWSPRDETIALDRAYAIAGVVKDTAGRPLANVAVFRRVSQHIWISTETDTRGAFRFDGVAAGESVLRASVHSHRATEGRPDGVGTVEARARAGATDVSITLDPGLEVVIRFPDPRGGDAYAEVVRLRAGTQPTSEGVSPDETGVARVRGLAADDRLTIWAPPDTEGRSAYHGDVRPGTEVTLSWSPGLTLSGRLSGPAGATHLGAHAIMVGTGIHVFAPRTADGRYELRGLPPGTRWTLSAHAELGEEWLQGTQQEVEAGATRDLDVKAP